MEKVSVDTKAIPMDLFDIKRYFFFKNYFKNKGRYVIYAVMLLVISFVVLKNFYFNAFSITLILVLYVLFIICSFLINLLMLLYHLVTAKSAFEKKKEFKKAQTHIVTKEGYTVDLFNQEVFIPWKELDCYKELKSGYMGYRINGIFVFFPKRDFDNIEDEQFVVECMKTITNKKDEEQVM